MKKKTTVKKNIKRTVAYTALAKATPVETLTDGSTLWAKTKKDAIKEFAIENPGLKPKKVARAIFTTFSV